MRLERLHLLPVATPEGVTFSFRLASPALRMLAWCIDVMVVNATWSILATAVGLLQLLSADLAGLVGAVAYFLLTQGYRMATEWLWRGQTLGKRVLHLRVIDAQGLHLSFAQIALRNLLRLIDALPVCYLVGGLTALLNRRGQRLGDLVAGTVVIWQPPEPQPNSDLFATGKFNSLRRFPGTVARLRQHITPAQAHATWQALARRTQLDEHERLRLYAEIASHFQRQTPIPTEALEGISDEQFLRNVVEVLFIAPSGPEKN
jgi:uncharacterized RDD family membrane protein YckC